jgi:signal transduction histidine kinase
LQDKLLMSDPVAKDLPSGMLSAVHEAALAITSELSLPVVLNRIVGLARDLVDARYAALGVPCPDRSGQLERFVTSGISDKEFEKIAHRPEGKGVLGELLRPDAVPLRLRNITDHPLSVGFPAHHPVMTSFLGVPIRSRGELLGSLYLADKIGADEFSEEDQLLVETLAAYAAVAIENAQLYQQVKRLAVLEERERIGMDLHDGIIQSIYAVGLTLEYAGLMLAEDPGVTQSRLQEAIDGLNTIIRDIRNYILDLRPQRLEGDDLESALQKLMREFRASTLAEINLDYDGRLHDTLSERSAVAAFHIAQEAMANAAKHAVATCLAVRVEMQDSACVLSVSDDGQGFSIKDTVPRLGHGLSNIDLRARSVGGRAEIHSEVGKGTTVKAYLPII